MCVKVNLYTYFSIRIFNKQKIKKHRGFNFIEPATMTRLIRHDNTEMKSSKVMKRDKYRN